MRRRNQSHPLARDDCAVNNDGHETGTKLVLFSVKIPFYQEDREDRDTAVPVTQCNELCIVTAETVTVRHRKLDTTTPVISIIPTHYILSVSVSETG